MSYEHKHHSGHAAGHQKTQVKDSERRTSDRQMFTATAEVVEETTGARFSTRTMDLGPGGCFVDTTNPLPVGSKVHVKLTKGKSDFKTGGTVVYSQHGMGMGIAFLDLKDEQQSDLKGWLAGIVSEKPLVFESSAAGVHKPVETQDAKTLRALTRLLRILVMKGILTEAEASSVLHDTVL
ncbi:MAG TPA: PilZ domain-containing protein [Candidatus Micrarchaeaceae archaeon]|nr:PilZ domain-containing protein [Candidatus Micrarchaeaceae archaeon]